MTRPRERPLVDDVADEMEPGEPYTIRELVERLDEHDPSETTVRSRLEELVENGTVQKKRHSSRVVTYRRVQS